MKKFILISIFVVGFVLFVLLMEMLNVDHILNIFLTTETNDKTTKSSKLLPPKLNENINFFETDNKVSK